MVKKLLFLFLGLLVLLNLTVPSVSAEEAAGCAYYFYGQSCTDCPEATAYVEKLALRYPNVNIETFELYYSPENAEQLKEYFAAYKVPEESQGLPVLFLSDSYFVGMKPITTLAEDSLINSPIKDCPSLEAVRAIGVTGENFPVDVVNTFSLSRLLKGALTDAFHPGALSMTLLFLIIMSAATTFSQLLSYGLHFILGVYFMSFLFSLGFLLWISTSSISIYFNRLVGIVAVVYGFFFVKNFVWKFRLFRLPETHRKKVYSLSGKIINSWIVLLVSLVAGLFSFAHASNVLLSLKFAFKGVSGWMSLPIVLLYLLIVDSPLIILMFVFFLIKQKSHLYSEKTENVQLWREHHQKVVRVVIGIISLILGLVLLFL
ncbi:hypothetical protein HYX12_03215 [Candidatus Woesearchaeota archaeon]|nr:hypothetical protein [Candidatus Woesearchaeota archaeon]